MDATPGGDVASRKGNALGGWIVIGLVIWGLAQCGRLVSGDHPGTPPAVPRQQTSVQQPEVMATATPPQPTSQPAELGVRYVTASSLNVRQSPDTSGAKVTSLPTGTAVQVFEMRGPWLRVTAGGGVEGWVHGDYTSATQPRAVPVATPAPQQAPAPAAAAGRPRSEIVQLIIARSINTYSGSCPCPYNVDRGGRRCGGRSAYSKPGGASPICYESDVSEGMIQRFGN